MQRSNNILLLLSALQSRFDVPPTDALHVRREHHEVLTRQPYRALSRRARSSTKKVICASLMVAVALSPQWCDAVAARPARNNPGIHTGASSAVLRLRLPSPCTLAPSSFKARSLPGSSFAPRLHLRSSVSRISVPRLLLNPAHPHTTRRTESRTLKRSLRSREGWLNLGLSVLQEVVNVCISLLSSPGVRQCI